VLPEIEREAIDAAAKLIFEWRAGWSPWLHYGRAGPNMLLPGPGLTWEPVSGFEPLTCRLQVDRGAHQARWACWRQRLGTVHLCPPWSGF
jgi:hypothetical protein